MTDRKLHLFFPENDLALARDLANYTPPVAAVRLRRSGEALPLWYGDKGDRFIAGGINAAWLDSIRNTFGMDVDVYDYHPELYAPAPWGWSKAAREVFLRAGYQKNVLPDDARLSLLRELSHRRTSAEIGRRLFEQLPEGSVAPAASELKSEDAVREFVSANGTCLLKLPWSSSGRGLTEVDPDNIESRITMIRGMLRNQGSVTGEKLYAKTIDFAMLFHLQNGVCDYDGISVFRTSAAGSYEGNILAPQAELEKSVKENVDSSTFDNVRTALSGIIQDIAGDVYEGPLGIDMIGVRGEQFTLAPAIELNLRMTMGHVCHRFYRDYVTEGSRGFFCIGTERRPDDFSTDRDRMVSGHLNMVPPGGSVCFSADLD